MLIHDRLVHASMTRWKSKVKPSTLAEKIGEGDRSKYVTGDQRRHRLGALLDQARDPATARTLLERIIEGNDLVGVNYLAIGTRRSRAVCRIQLRDATGRTVGYGTGFLVAPGVLMTNHHVLAGADDARNALAEFDYEYDADGLDKPVAVFGLRVDTPPIAYQPLDFCLAAVAPRSLDGSRSLDEFGWLPLNGTPGKAIIGEYLTIVQHPGGERKQVCVRENKLLKYDPNGTTLWYKTDTVAGSSGSPVFNPSWQVVALHHSGVPETDDQGRWLTVDGQVWDRFQDESRVKWIANEGIRISAIFQYLSTQYADSTLAAPVLNPPPPPRATTAGGNDGDGNPEFLDGRRSELVGDELRVTIPLRVAIRVGADGGGLGRGGVPAPAAAPGPTARGPVDGRPQPLVPAGIERVVVDQSDYAKRPGYDPAFLGKAKLQVPLPKVKSLGDGRQLAEFTVGGKKTQELKYWNYSVLLNKARRLAFVSAVNVDAELRPKDAGRDGDKWYFDARVDEKFQLGADFYGKQREFEADRSQNPFDKGHLTRRLDAQWGKPPALASRNGNDSFHWTNCSPQHWKFNQGAKRWLGLEDYVIDGVAGASGRRASVFNGPIFDGPLSTLGEDGQVALDLGGPSSPDPTFGDVAIPKAFFKVVVCVRERRLVAAAFLMSQEDLLATTDRIQGLVAPPEERLTEAEAKLYQVSVADLQKVAKIDFGLPADADLSLTEGARSRAPREIARLEEIRC